MSILPKEGRIVMVLEPVNGRFGVHKMMAQLSTNSHGVNWDGEEVITVITFNRRRTRCKILTCDKYGVTYSVRILHTGLFSVKLEEGLIPRNISRTQLEELMNYGCTGMA